MRQTQKLFCAALLMVLPGCGRAQPANSAPLLVEKTIPLAGVAGRIDHLAADPERRRVFVAELGNGSLDVVDLESGKTRRIGGLKEPQGIGIFPRETGRMLVPNRG